jgi:hypothetical protein
MLCLIEIANSPAIGVSCGAGMHRHFQPPQAAENGAFQELRLLERELVLARMDNNQHPN